MVQSPWKDTFYVRMYELARAGTSDRGIASALGVHLNTLKKWKAGNSAVRDAIERGRSVVKGQNRIGFTDYVYKKLPKKLRKLWRKLKTLEDKNKNTKERLDAMFNDAGKNARQHLFVHALVCANFNASEACRQVGISKKTVEGWMACEPDFVELINELKWHRGNFFESALHKAVKDGEVPAVIFANKTFNRDRGYAEKVQVEHNHTGTINHVQTVSIEDLDLPVEVRKIILQAYREQKRLNAPQTAKLGHNVIEGEFTKKSSLADRLAALEDDED